MPDILSLGTEYLAKDCERKGYVMADCSDASMSVMIRVRNKDQEIEVKAYNVTVAVAVLNDLIRSHKDFHGWLADKMGGFKEGFDA